MFTCKELKVLYAVVVVIAKAMTVNSGSVVSARSPLARYNDDYDSLEACTSKNQQRVGNVFGNFTRHHKKGHRRRTTTSTTPSTALSTVFSFEPTPYESTSEHIFDTSTTLLHRPIRKLRDTSLSFDEFNTLDEEQTNTLDDLAYRNHYVKHTDRIKGKNEIVQELDVMSLTLSSLRTKKSFRDTTSSNKLKSGKMGGIFVTENCTTVLAQIGTTAVLHCEVSDITENTVTWIRRKDYSLLSVGLVTYSADSRFFSAHGKHVKDWALHIRYVTSADGGHYECQVPTHPPTSIFFKLVLVAAYAEIVGESEKIIHEGSMLKLICMVRKSTEPPSYVFWYFENRMINYDLNGVSVHNGRHNSELVIISAAPRHAGNYTCVPANARAASVTVHVVQSETPAAMQHGNNSSPTNCHTAFVIYLQIFIITFIITL